MGKKHADLLRLMLGKDTENDHAMKQRVEDIACLIEKLDSDDDEACEAYLVSVLRDKMRQR